MTADKADSVNRWWRKPWRRRAALETQDARAEIRFCMDDGCRRPWGHDGQHDITWQEKHGRR